MTKIILRKLKQDICKTPWIRTQVSRSLSDLQSYVMAKEPQVIRCEQLFYYFIRDWVQLGEKSYGNILYPEEFYLTTSSGHCVRGHKRKWLSTVWIISSRHLFEVLQNSIMRYFDSFKLQMYKQILISQFCLCLFIRIQ